MPEIDEALQQTYPLLGGNIQVMPESDKSAVLKLLDDQVKTFWRGLVENQITMFS